MEGTQMPSNDEEKAKEFDWREELISPPRMPKPGWGAVEELLSQSLRARVSLRERAGHTDIVLTFPSSSRKLPERVQKAYSQLGMDLRAVFSEILWKKPRRGSSTLWSELVRAGYKAYRHAWIHWQELLYLEHFYPSVDQAFRKELDELRKNTRRSVGRRQALEEERQSRRRRFRQLLLDCREIHKIVELCVEKNQDQLTIRKAVFHKIHGRRIDDLVLRRNDSAFDEIPYVKRDKIVSLTDHTSWKPVQLARALLACERRCAYQTIEKETAVARRRTESSKTNRNK
jgi:hypothetical protein